jgi:hypothetical protein
MHTYLTMMKLQDLTACRRGYEPTHDDISSSRHDIYFDVFHCKNYFVYDEQAMIKCCSTCTHWLKIDRWHAIVLQVMAERIKEGTEQKLACEEIYMLRFT